MENSITVKEADYLSDLMTYESMLCKKCEFYGKTIFDESVSQTFVKLGEEAKERFKALLGVI